MVPISAVGPTDYRLEAYDGSTWQTLISAMGPVFGDVDEERHHRILKGKPYKIYRILVTDVPGSEAGEGGEDGGMEKFTVLRNIQLYTGK